LQENGDYLWKVDFTFISRAMYKAADPDPIRDKRKRRI